MSYEKELPEDNIDATKINGPSQSDSTDSGSDAPKSGKIAKGAKLVIVSVIALAVFDVVTSGYLRGASTEKTETESAVPVAVVAVEGAEATVVDNEKSSVPTLGPAPVQIENVRVSMPSSLDSSTSRTLEQFNSDERLTETVEILKQAVNNINKRLDSKSKSTDSLRATQEIIFNSVVSLHKTTSSQEVLLEDGSFVSPQNNGSSYNILSASGITTTIEKGTFIVIPTGYIIQNNETTTLYFAFTNPAEDSEITNLYEASSLHGLRDKTTDSASIERVKKIISSGGNDRVVVTKYKNSVIAFNGFGQVSSVKRFKKETVSDVMQSSLLEDSVRGLNGFDTDSNYKYRLRAGSLYKGDRVVTVSGQTTDLYLRYAEYQPDKTENPIKMVEVLNDSDELLKQFPTKKISRVLLNQISVDGEDYIVREGNIYKVSSYGAEELKGAGSIVGKIVRGSLQQEKIILQHTEERYNELSEFAGKVLVGRTGIEYSVGEEYVTIQPGDAYEKTSNYYLSSIGSLVSKVNMEVKDSIITVKNKSKIGGRIISENYIVEIKSLNKATILNKKTMVSKVYLNPVLSFVDEEWIALHANTAHNHNSDKQEINGIEYSKMVEVKPKVFNYYDVNGELINQANPDFNFNKILVLKERVIDVERIEGDAFDYLYRINLQTGEVSAEGVIGKLLIDAEKKRTKNLFNSISTEVELANKEIDINDKTVYTLDEMISRHPHLSKIKFKMMNEDELKVVSGSSIIINGKKLSVETGKYNSNLGIFVFNLSEGVDGREKRSLTGSMNSNRFERTVRLVTNEAPNYFNETITVATLAGGKKVVGIRNPGYGTQWTSVYDESVDLKKSVINLTIKPFNDNTASSSSLSVGLNNIRVMSKTMRDDMVLQYNKYKSVKVEDKATLIPSVQKATENVKILESQLADLNQKLGDINGKSLSLQTFRMSDEDLAVASEEELKKESTFSFDIGTKLSYEVKKSIEVVQGVDSLIYTDLNQSFIEDREGNQLSMVNPVVVLKVAGDFNTNKVKFYPVQIVYTDAEQQRKIINIPFTSTVMEYKDSSSPEIMDGVPAYYVNQKMANLGTTVMLSSVQGVVESLTAPDDGFGGALAGLSGGAEETQSAFTDGVASGASEGIGAILDSMKEKSDGKKDLLITTGGLEITSVFVITTPVSGQ